MKKRKPPLEGAGKIDTCRPVSAVLCPKTGAENLDLYSSAGYDTIAAKRLLYGAFDTTGSRPVGGTAGDANVP